MSDTLHKKKIEIGLPLSQTTASFLTLSPRTEKIQALFLWFLCFIYRKARGFLQPDQTPLGRFTLSPTRTRALVRTPVISCASGGKTPSADTRDIPAEAFLRRAPRGSSRLLIGSAFCQLRAADVLSYFQTS